ncbi:MAG: FlgD immunoglobulin-like domain containing protein, partial [Bacteroidota bacterium]
PFAVTWDGGDPNANVVAYRWQLATDPEFTDLVLDADAGTTPTFETTVGVVNDLLRDAGVDVGTAITLYHRALASDGSFGATGAGVAVTLTRGVSTPNESGPEALAFRATAAPNPFRATTRLRLELPEAAEVTVEVYDIVGRRVLTVSPGAVASGPAEVEIDGRDLGAGTYLWRVRADAAGEVRTATGRFSIVR